MCEIYNKIVKSTKIVAHLRNLQGFRGWQIVVLGGVGV